MDGSSAAQVYVVMPGHEVFGLMMLHRQRWQSSVIDLLS